MIWTAEEAMEGDNDFVRAQRLAPSLALVDHDIHVRIERGLQMLRAEHDRRVTELLAATTAEVERRREAEEEVAFWRREMLAKLLGLTAVLAAATAKGDHDRAANLRANHIMPILNAFRDARVKLWHEPCASCGDFIRPGTGYVYLGDDFGSVHEGCAGEFGPVARAVEFDEAAIIAAAAAAVNESVAPDA